MNTNEMNMKELNLNELEQANGGWDWLKAAMGSIIGGAGGAGIGLTVSGFLVASGPVGWAILAGGAVGAVAVGAIAGNFD